jgi:DNA-binding response OmpR family regulator
MALAGTRWSRGPGPDRAAIYAADHMQKPFSPDELRPRVQAVIDRRSHAGGLIEKRRAG